MSYPTVDHVVDHWGHHSVEFRSQHSGYLEMELTLDAAKRFAEKILAAIAGPATEVDP